MLPAPRLHHGARTSLVDRLSLLKLVAQLVFLEGMRNSTEGRASVWMIRLASHVSRAAREFMCACLVYVLPLLTYVTGIAFDTLVAMEPAAAAVTARNLPLEVSTGWWKGLGKSRPPVHQGAFVAWPVQFGGRMDFDRTPPVSVSRFGKAGRNPVHYFRNSGLRSVTVDPSMRLRALTQEAGCNCHCTSWRTESLLLSVCQSELAWHVQCFNQACEATNDLTGRIRLTVTIVTSCTQLLQKFNRQLDSAGLSEPAKDALGHKGMLAPSLTHPSATVLHSQPGFRWCRVREKR
jgi:hypothetical protein